MTKEPETKTKENWEEDFDRRFQIRCLTVPSETGKENPQNRLVKDFIRELLVTREEFKMSDEFTGLEPVDYSSPTWLSGRKIIEAEIREELAGKVEEMLSASLDGGLHDFSVDEELISKKEAIRVIKGGGK